MSDAARTCNRNCIYNKESKFCTYTMREIEREDIILCANYDYCNDTDYVYGESK